MFLNDKIYKKARIEEPILTELIKSPSLQRLKHISQYGVPDEYYHLKNYSRYEHSVGVMLLLRKLGANLEEQVAGLIHDISHYAFSHVADWVFSEGNKGNEELQNTLLEKFVKNDKIAKILTKYGFSTDRLLNEENFSLLEKKIPDLCADRMDYALREFKYWLNPSVVGKCLQGLTNYNGEIVFNNEDTALVFASNFLELQTKHWGGFEAMFRYHLFSAALKLAIEEKKLKRNDFYEDEVFVLDKLKKQKNKKISEILNTLRKKELRKYKKNSGKRVYKKFRYVDPKIIKNRKLIRLSVLNPKFENLIEKHRKINKKGLFV